MCVGFVHLSFTTLQGIQKEKKELLKKVKTFEKEKLTWEDQQYAKVRLISGLQKEQAELKQRLETAENDRKSQSEAEVQSLKTKINKLQKELQSNKSSKDQLEKEIAREKTR